MASRLRSCIAAVALASATAVAIPAQGSEKADGARFLADLEALTAPEMAGREPGTAGGRLAEDYLAERFADLGLEVADGLRGYRQAFEVDDPRPARVDCSETRLGAELGSGTVAWKLAADFLPFGFSAEGAVAGRLVFAGHGLVIPELGRDDYDGLDVDGAVVLVLRGAPGWRDAESPFWEHRRALRFTEKIARAAERGARGFLFVDPEFPVDPSGTRALLERAVRARGESRIPAVWGSWAVARRLLAADGRDPEAARSGDRSRVRSGGGAIRVDLRVRFADRRPPRRTANVVGVLVGRDPELRDEVIVIGAHHDHIGRGQFGSLRPGAAGEIHPGADDNASGCAALIGVAERLVAGPRPRRTVVFVAFGAEELGLRGSAHFLESGLIPAVRITSMVNLNMIGRATAERLRIEGVGSGDGLDAVVRAAGLTVGRQPQTRSAATPRSDHASFLAQRIPALFVHSGLHDDYHTPDDLASRVLVPESLEVVRLTAVIVIGLGDADRRCAFIEVAREFRRRRP